MEEIEKNNKHLLEVTGAIANGRQFDVDITLPEDNRDVVYGVLKDSYGDPIFNAVVKLIEVETSFGGKEERKPISHTFTNKSGEFVFGPLCPRKHYAIDIWANRVDHIKICKTCKNEGHCLKGVHIDCDKHCVATHEESELPFAIDTKIEEKDND